MIILLAQSILGYDQNLAKRLIGYSAIAYQSQNNIRFWNCSKCKEFPLSDPYPTANALLDVGAYTGFQAELNSVLVAFHGTSDTRAFVLNDFKLINSSVCPGCQIDDVYSKLYDAVKDNMTNNVQNLLKRYPNSPVVVTGHAIGGALAGLFAAQLRTKGVQVASVYTFGQTRIGNDKFANFVTVSLQNKLFRVVHYADAAVHYPSMNLGFRHYAQEIFYSQDMRFSRSCDPNNGEDNGCSNSVLVIYYNFDDNSLQAYDRMGLSLQH